MSEPPVPLTVIVVRHAQSEHHVRGLTGGWTDTPLTAHGHTQARRLAARLGRELAGQAVALYTSDLIRAMQTAAAVGAALGVQPIGDARLREHNNGAAAGLTVAEARARYPAAFSGLYGLDTRPFPDAETWNEFSARVAGFLAALPATGPAPVLITHGGTLMTIIAWWLRLPPPVMERAWFGAAPTGITVLRADAWGQRGLDRLSDVAHLADGDTLPPLANEFALA